MPMRQREQLDNKAPKKSICEARSLRNVAQSLRDHCVEWPRSRLVDALTRLAGETQNAGDRTDADQTAAGLLELVA